jgi:hypothetical protein
MESYSSPTRAIVALAACGLAAGAGVAAGQDDDPRLRLAFHRGTQTIRVQTSDYHCLPQEDGSSLCLDGGVPTGRIGGRRLVVRPSARIGLRPGYPANEIRAVIEDAHGRARTHGLRAAKRDSDGTRFRLTLPDRLPRRMDRLRVSVTHTDGNGGVLLLGVRRPK